CMQALENPLTF
nr:immunoglobulin light chain junction region [Macaca mulatta]MOX10488.1 immunoglobulin light chain junction region [Macaca mulatta]